MHGLLFSFLSLSYMSSLISGASLLLFVIHLSEVEHLVALVQSITPLVLKCSLNAVTRVFFNFISGWVSQSPSLFEPWWGPTF